MRDDCVMTAEIVARSTLEVEGFLKEETLTLRECHPVPLHNRLRLCRAGRSKLFTHGDHTRYLTSTLPLALRSRARSNRNRNITSDPRQCHIYSNSIAHTQARVQRLLTSILAIFSATLKGWVRQMAKSDPTTWYMNYFKPAGSSSLVTTGLASHQSHA